MARVPKAELDRLKQEVSLERLAELRGVELAKVGKDLRGRCPFHGPDEDPSLSIDPKRNVFHCFGCGAKGTVIDWVMKAEGVSFRHAVELLRQDASLDVAERRETTGKGGAPLKVSTVRRLEAPVDFDAEGAELLEQVVGYYHQTLLESPKALEYLKERGLDDPELLTTFRLGYANRTLGYRLPERNRKAGGRIRGKLQELGIYRETGHEHLNGCVVFPTLDEHGRVVGLYGRKVTRSLAKSVARHLYLPGPRRGIWNRDALRSEEVILCESHVDAATFWCAGYRHVTTAWGCRGLTEEHVEAFLGHGVERVLLAFDRDEAGEKGAAAAAERLLAAGIGCYRVEFPHGMDANDYAQNVQPATKSLGLALRRAVWMGSGAAPTRAFLEPEVAEPESSARETPISSPPGPEPPSEPPPEPSASPATSPASDPEPSSPPSPSPASLLASSTPLASSPESPRPAAPAVPAEVSEREVVIRLGDRRWRVRGLEKNLSYELLKLNLLASRGEGFHVDTFDLYSARHRASFVKQAAVELGVDEDVVKHDMGRVLLKLEELQEEQIQRALKGPRERREVAISEAEREAALELLRSPGLLERLVSDLTRCGLVGEDTNKLVAYLAAVSRKLERPLAVLVQSSSAAGKSTLMDTILSLVPEEERVAYSAMTGQALFYMSEIDLKHKVLAIAEEEGAERASYALKLLQSEGELTIASTGKDPATGRLVTQEYRVEGPVMIFSTTTAIDVDEELMNRCLVLAVDESREQTRAIHRYQRKSRTLEGLREREERQAIRRLHRNAQRLLRPLPVVNPYAERLSFLDESTRTRRDHEKYLTLIDTIALLHQHQRPLKRMQHRGREREYVEVLPSDIEAAHAIAHEVLGRSLDELPPQTRRLLELLDRLVKEGCARLSMKQGHYRFTRRDVRETTSWGDTQLKVHLARLVELEYLVVHEGGRGRPYVYELVYDGEGQDGTPFLAGLADIGSVTGHGYDTKRSGQKANRSGSGRPPVGLRSGDGRGGFSVPKPSEERDLEPEEAENAEAARLGATETEDVVAVDAEEPEALAVAASGSGRGR